MNSKVPWHIQVCLVLYYQYYGACLLVKNVVRCIRMKFILWRNPELKDLQRLSGVKNDHT